MSGAPPNKARVAASAAAAAASPWVSAVTSRASVCFASRSAAPSARVSSAMRSSGRKV